VGRLFKGNKNEKMNEVTAPVITDEHREYAANALHNFTLCETNGMRLVDLRLDEAVNQDRNAR